VNERKEEQGREIKGGLGGKEGWMKEDG